MYDPPYSVRQVAECYKQVGFPVTQETTRANFWSDTKKEIARIVRPGGKVISCDWNSGGIGKVLGFEIIRILLVPHGGIHNDTIITVEIKGGMIKSGVCPRCKGIGEVYYLAECNPVIVTSVSHKAKKTCPLCEGSREVKNA